MNTVTLTITLPEHAATGDEYLTAILMAAAQHGDARARAALYGLVPFIRTTRMSPLSVPPEQAAQIAPNGVSKFVL